MLPVPVILQSLRVVGHDDRAQGRGHGVAVLRARQATAVVLTLGADQQLRVVGQVEVDGALEFDCPDEVFVPAAHQHLRLARIGRGFVDGALEGGAVERLPSPTAPYFSTSKILGCALAL